MNTGNNNILWQKYAKRPTFHTFNFSFYDYDLRISERMKWEELEREKKPEKETSSNYNFNLLFRKEISSFQYDSHFGFGSELWVLFIVLT